MKYYSKQYQDIMDIADTKYEIHSRVLEYVNQRLAKVIKTRNELYIPDTEAWKDTFETEKIYSFIKNMILKEFHTEI